MKILYATFELAPFTKVGGLADVMGALPKHIEDKDSTIAIFTPLIKLLLHQQRCRPEAAHHRVRLHADTT